MTFGRLHARGEPRAGAARARDLNHGARKMPRKRASRSPKATVARAGAIPTRAGTSPAQRAPASATSRRVSSSPAGVLSDVDAAALAYGQGVLSGDEDDGESDEELEMPDDPSSSSDSGEEPDADQGVAVCGGCCLGCLHYMRLPLRR